MNYFCQYARLLSAAIVLLLSTTWAHAADSYNGTTLAIPSITIGNATYTNMVVTVGSIVGDPIGSAPIGVVDSYNPANNLLTIPAVAFAGKIFYNVVTTVGSLVSVQSVSGADTYSSPDLTIPAIQVGNTVYEGVKVGVGSVVSFNGGMPLSTVDTYNPSTQVLVIPVVQVAGGRVYTNVSVKVSGVKSIASSHPVTPSIAVKQTTVLLTAVGQTATLQAGPVDAQGAPIAGTVTWTSSNPAAVSVNGSGKITAQKIGSALLFAAANGTQSQPIFVVVAEPAPGALILTDAQIISVGDWIGLAAGEAPGVGTQYEVTVSGITTAPLAGTVVLGSGDKPVAGIVVAVSNDAGNLVLTLAIAPLTQVLQAYNLDWDIDLATLPVAVINIDSSTAATANAAFGKAQPQGSTPTFQAFTCDAKIEATGISTKISLTPQLGAHLIVQSWRNDPDLPDGYVKLALTGSQALKGTIDIMVNPGVKGMVTCKAQAQVRIPVGGIVAVLVMPALRLGVGFTLDGSIVAATAELKTDGTIGATETIGFECSSSPGGCASLNDVSVISDFQFTSKVPSVNDLRVMLSGQIFALVGIDAVIGLGLANAEIVEARIGPTQSFDLAFPEDQAENLAMSSSYKLTLDGVIEPGAALAKAIKTLIDQDNVTLNFKIPFTTPLAESPKGTLAISTNDVAYGHEVDFQVHLDKPVPVTYPLLGPGGSTIYNVVGIQLYRKKTGDAQYTLWQTLNPVAGQTTFQTSWTPTATDQGDYQFAAFVDTAMPVPVLEIADDTVQALHVRGPGWGGTVTFTIQGSAVVNQNGGGNIAIVTTYTDSGSGTMQLEATAGSDNVQIMTVTQGSGTLTNSWVKQTNNNYVFGGCSFVTTQNEQNTATATLSVPDSSLAVLSIPGDGTYQITIPFLAGAGNGTDHVTASETVTGPNCQGTPPTDITSTFQNNVQTQILVVNGTVAAGQTTISGSMNLPFAGTPDDEYQVSWNLQK